MGGRVERKTERLESLQGEGGLANLFVRHWRRKDTFQRSVYSRTLTSKQYQPQCEMVDMNVCRPSENHLSRYLRLLGYAYRNHGPENPALAFLLPEKKKNKRWLSKVKDASVFTFEFH